MAPDDQDLPKGRDKSRPYIGNRCRPRNDKIFSTSSPARLGYRMPAEWEKHESTWLAWPHDLETWPDGLEELETIYVDMVVALHEAEKVHILVNDASEEEKVAKKLRARGITHNVFFHRVKTAGVWIRDYGPIFLVQRGGGMAFTKWVFNAWGGKYPALMSDNHVVEQLTALSSMCAFHPQLVLEGGSIDVNGVGTCLATEQCLLNPNRNPNLGRDGIEQYLRDYLGIRHLIWLSRGIVGDDTDGHVDCVARFVNSRTIVVAREKDPVDANFSVLEESWKHLENSVDQEDRAFSLVPLPMPEVVVSGGVRFPASYVNFYIGNSSVLVPIYGCRRDREALNILQNLFTDRKVIGIPCRPLIRGLGAIHCVTQPQPSITI